MLRCIKAKVKLATSCSISSEAPPLVNEIIDPKRQEQKSSQRPTQCRKAEFTLAVDQVIPNANANSPVSILPGQGRAQYELSDVAKYPEVFVFKTIHEYFPLKLLDNLYKIPN